MSSNETQRTKNTARIAGLLLCAGGLLLTAGALGALIDPDGVIRGTSKLLAVKVGRVCLVATGLVLLLRGAGPRVGTLALVVGVVVAGAGLWARLIERPLDKAPGQWSAAQRPPILPFDELCEWVSREDPYFGTAKIDKYTAALERAVTASVDSFESAIAREELADVLLRHGRNEEAIAHLEQALEDLIGSAAEPDSVNRVRRALGIALLRSGETEHCIEMHNPERCLFPIERGGIWSDASGALSAVAVFEDYLADRPDDLDVRWLLNLAYMAAGTYPDAVPARWLIPRSLIEVDDPGVGRFEDVAGAAGVDTFNMAGGVILDDFDGDGLVDVFTSSMSVCEHVRYYRNRGDGTFEDRTEAAGVKDQLGGFNCIQADYDNDGRLDIYIMRGAWQGEVFGTQRDTLLRQRDDGTFEDATVAAGLGREAYPTQVAGWSDYDLDGDVDLFVGNEYFPGQLFRNEGDGSFVEVAELAGVTNGADEGKYACAKGATWGDYDNDGAPDLYVSNYGNPNRLYHNLGDGTFADVAPEFGLDELTSAPAQESGARRGMTSALGKDLTSARGKDVTFATWWWDFDNDGWLDLYVGGFGATLEDVVADYLGEPTAENRRLRLYRNLNGKGFENVAERMDMADIRLPMGANYGDVDNDGWPDFYLGTGRPPFEFLVPNVLYRNVGGERFIDVTTAAGVGHLQKGHGVAFADIDNDGDQDIFAQMGGFYVADAFRDALFVNPGNANHWITVVLRGVISNRAGIGARLEAHVATRDGTRVIHALAGSGGSFGASSLQQEIGLGDAARIEKLVVRWPASGIVQELRDVAIDAFVEVREDEGAVRVLGRSTVPFFD